MTKRGVFTGVFIASIVYLSGVAVLAAGPNFSGTWELDKSEERAYRANGQH
jgi:hypothetical protein